MNEASLRDRPIIQIRNLSKVYFMGEERVIALKNINLSINRGEICCIFGTSGSGKSTLLNQLAGLEKPTRGEVFIGGKNISRMTENQLAAFRQKHLGFVFQSYNLLKELPAVENVAMPLMFRGIDKETGSEEDAVPGRTEEPHGSFPGTDVRRTAAARGNRPRVHIAA